MAPDLQQSMLSKLRERVRNSRCGPVLRRIIDSAKPLFDHVIVLKRNFLTRNHRNETKRPPVVFIHIPKTGGTLVEEELRQKLRMVKIHRPVLYKHFNNFGSVSPGHILWERLLDNGYVSKEFNARAFKFAVVRNPYSRFISAYNFCRLMGSTKADSLSKFLFEAVESVKNKSDWQPHFASPQTTWILDNEGRSLVDRVYKLEELGALRNDFLRRFSVDMSFEKTINKGSGSAVAKDLLTDTSLLQQFNAFYRDDFDLFGYEFRQ